MTHLCYTLEEAAERLNLSETVLVRLSQYFKVPQSAYEDTGYVSFKGDLSFSDQDIAFFRQVREHLLAGESLEEVKARIRYENVPLATPSQPVAPGQPVEARPVERAAQIPLPQPAPPQPPQSYATGMSSPIHEVIDRAPFEKAAQRNLARYKENQRYGIGRVFENLLKEVGGSGRSAPAPEKAPAKASGGGVMQPLRKLKETLQNRTAALIESASNPYSHPKGYGAPGLSQGPIGTMQTEEEELYNPDSLLPFRPIRRNRAEAPPVDPLNELPPTGLPAAEMVVGNQPAFQDMLNPSVPRPQVAPRPMQQAIPAPPAINRSAMPNQNAPVQPPQAPLQQSPRPAAPVNVPMTPLSPPSAGPMNFEPELPSAVYQAQPAVARPGISAPLEPTLDHMLRQAPAQPRALNRQLRSAANQLRERTMSQDKLR